MERELSFVSSTRLSGRYEIQRHYTNLVERQRIVFSATLNSPRWLTLILTRMRFFQPEKYLDAFSSLMHEKFMHVAPTADFSTIVILRRIASDATIMSLHEPVTRRRQHLMSDHLLLHLHLNPFESVGQTIHSLSLEIPQMNERSLIIPASGDLLGSQQFGW